MSYSCVLDTYLVILCGSQGDDFSICVQALCNNLLAVGCKEWLPNFKLLPNLLPPFLKKMFHAASNSRPDAGLPGAAEAWWQFDTCVWQLAFSVQDPVPVDVLDKS